MIARAGGIYVKAGQQPIAPRPFQIVLRELMDDGGRRPFEEDARTFRERVEGRRSARSLIKNRSLGVVGAGV